MSGVTEQRMVNISKKGSEMHDIPSWSDFSTPNTTMNTCSTSSSAISSITDNVLPVSLDRHFASEKQPHSQQQPMRCVVSPILLDKSKANFGSTESHEKVNKCRCHRFKRFKKLLKRSSRSNHRRHNSSSGKAPYLSVNSLHSDDTSEYSNSTPRSPLKLRVCSSDPSFQDSHSQSEFEKMIRCGVDCAIIQCSVGSKKNRRKETRQKQEKIVTLFLGGYGRDKFLGWCAPGAKSLSCRCCNCIQLDNLDGIDIFEPSNMLPLRKTEGLNGTWKRDNRRLIKLVGTSCNKKKMHLTIFLNNDMVDDIVWEGFVNLNEQFFWYTTMELSSNFRAIKFSQSSSLL